MALTKTITIDGKEVTFRVSAAIPRLYRVKFHRGIYRDLDALQKAMDASDEGASTLDTFSLELFENISYIMARHADPSVPDSPEEWLEQFNTFSIYQVLPEIIELWGLNLQTDVTAKKTASDRAAHDHGALPAALRADRPVHPGSGSSDHRNGQRSVRREQER